MGVVPTAWDLKRQVDWEVEGFRRAAQRYREVAAVQTLDALPPGQRLLREIVPPLTAAIQEEQDRVGDPNRGQPTLWMWPIQLAPADVMAVITVTTVMRGTCSPEARERDGYRVVSVAKAVADAVRIQVEYDAWAAGNDKVAERLRRRFPNLDNRVWRRWRDRLNAARHERWDEPTRVGVGTALLGLLVAAAPTRFAIETIQRGTTRSNVVRVTDATLELIEDVTTRAEIARPVYMPMVMPPIRWAYGVKQHECT